MNRWNCYWRIKLDQSIIVYGVDDGKVYGGSNPSRTVKQVQEDSDGYYPGGDFTIELDLSNRSFAMWMMRKSSLIARLAIFNQYRQSLFCQRDHL